MNEPRWPAPQMADDHPSRDDRPDLTHKEAPVVKKSDALAFLREELDEKRTDAVLQYISDKAKRVLPDLPVEIAEQVLDLLLPELLFEALERVLPD